MNNQKKLVAAFRSFVDKVFLPSLKKTDPQALEWNKFSSLLNTPIINHDEVLQYVQTINSSSPNLSSPSTFQRRQIPHFKKNKVENDNSIGQSGGFNPSKTFGGERARMMIMKGDEQFGDRRDNSNGYGFSNRFQDRSNRSFGSNAQNYLPGLQGLCKTFLQNQHRIESLLSSGNYVGGSNSKYS